MCNLTKGGAIGVNIFVGNLSSLIPPATGGDYFLTIPTTKEPISIPGTNADGKCGDEHRCGLLQSSSVTCFGGRNGPVWTLWSQMNHWMRYT